jgi:hypothetical protein
VPRWPIAVSVAKAHEDLRVGMTLLQGADILEMCKPQRPASSVIVPVATTSASECAINPRFAVGESDRADSSSLSSDRLNVRQPTDNGKPAF